MAPEIMHNVACE